MNALRILRISFKIFLEFFMKKEKKKKTTDLFDNYLYFL